MSILKTVNVFFYFLLIKKSKKMHHGFCKNIGRTTVLKIDNNKKYFLSTKSAY